MPSTILSTLEGGTGVTTVSASGFFAGPTSGPASALVFRNIQSTDLPSSVVFTNDSRFSRVTVNTVTASSYTFQLTDVGGVVEGTAAASGVFTIPGTGSVLFTAGDVWEVCQYGTGQIIIAGAAGIVLRSSGNKVKTYGQYSSIGIRYRGLGEFILSGDLGT